MQVESSPLARIRMLELTPTGFRRLASVNLAALYVLVTTGAVVRLTASGLGCANWPRCGDTPFPERDFHAYVEFGNRALGLVPITLTILTWLAARRTPGLERWVVRLAGAVALGTLAQGPLGGLTVLLELHPLLVMSHFLLAMLVVGGAVVILLGAVRLQSGEAPALSGELRWLGTVVAAACLALVVTGAFVTAAGPHPGGSDVERLGTPRGMIEVHAGATAFFGLAFVFLLGYLAGRRRRFRLQFASALAVLALILGQVAVGEIQYRTDLPWWLVLVHVGMAAAIWGATVALAMLLWLPPRLAVSGVRTLRRWPTSSNSPASRPSRSPS